MCTLRSIHYKVYCIITHYYNTLLYIIKCNELSYDIEPSYISMITEYDKYSYTTNKIHITYSNFKNKTS